ncbi:MAG: phosphatidate cytidylyltransferase [Chloroflexota bacterium]
MTRTRIITGLISLPIVIALIQWGSWPFSIVITVIALVAAWEFGQMMVAKGHQPSLFFSVILVLVTLTHMRFPEWQLLVPGLTISIIVILIWELFQTTSDTQPVDWALTTTGSLYIGLGLGHLIGLRLLPEGYVWVWLAIACTWGADTFAYFGGRTFGRHAFWPRWSPKKTWEGFVAGILGGMFGGWVVVLVHGFPLMQALIIGVIVALVGPFGDLSMSMMKRYTGVKDSSDLIPGHGGVLDRVDSVIFSAIVVYYYAVWVLEVPS